MPSRLFRAARACLSKEERKSFSKFAAWLRRLHGGRLSENLQGECHLVGDKDFGDPEELASFLRRCADHHGKARTKSERLKSHASACSAHELRGLRIPRAHLPGELLRYCVRTKLAGDLMERMLGSRARRLLKAGLTDTGEASSRLASAWDPAKLRNSDKLARRAAAFATFEHPAGAPRNDPLGMAQALALPTTANPASLDEILIEFSYGTDSVANHRFPTVADAGGHPLFEPAREAAPDPAVPGTCSGYTRPLGKQPQQPELVHQNESLRALNRAPRFVGRIRT